MGRREKSASSLRCSEPDFCESVNVGRFSRRWFEVAPFLPNLRGLGRKTASDLHTGGTLLPGLTTALGHEMDARRRAEVNYRESFASVGELKTRLSPAARVWRDCVLWPRSC